ncbi:hypothetical protein CI109_103715 [Kwoniella shandongensis]|uniref:Uncharacterized protein n=1 Tax=Kwoniella shandongensis TaxID=1734106 RepID=A0A5M6C7B6_9TREE|nr:uncharacterized protein CI109_000589 [Kwoniella shandongensis]KAA5531017.1 hypothetical protein CI109_000589 [Kwoniella shandongensis]
MAGPISFTPKHTQPFTLEEAMQLEVETLTAEINRLTNSIQHLSQTQDELRGYLNSEEGRSDPDTGEVKKAVEENEEVIASQSERISLITVALMNKLGGEARLEHYGLKLDEVFKKYGGGGGGGGGSDTRTATIPTSASTVESEAQSPDDEGLHL